MTYMQAKATATYDLYGPIHKALRLAETNLLVAVGRTDPLNADERNTAIDLARAQSAMAKAT